MASTYTKGSTTDRNRARLEIGDTDSARWLFDDDELDDLITQEGSMLGAAARACEILAARYAREFDFSADGHNFRKGGISQMYAAQAKRLRSKAGSDLAIPQRVDAYSDDIKSDDVTTSGGVDWDRGRFDS